MAGHVAIVELRRLPYNYFDPALIAGLADIYEQLDVDGQCRAIVLAAAGKAFCAGMDHSRPRPAAAEGSAPRTVMGEAIRLFRTRKPVIAAVEGPATGGGMGLALSADFRVTCPDARFWPNFSRLGLHAGFGLTVTLPRLVGAQQAALLLLTGRRVGGDEAAALGIADMSVPGDDVRGRSLALAEEIASSAPLAVTSMRATLRTGLADAVAAAMRHEEHHQDSQRQTDDFREGTAAVRDRRVPRFQGR